MTRLPHGFTVRLASAVRQYNGGRTLVGGVPTRVITLSRPARRTIVAGAIHVQDPTSATVAEHLLDAGIAHPDLSHLTPASLDDLTIVIPVRDRPAQLGRLLSAVGSATRVIVVDDASVHEAEIAEQCATAGAELIRLAVNVGPAAARNAGLAIAATDFVAFIDSDVQLEPADLSLLTGHFADPQVALVAPRVRGWSSSAPPRWFEQYDIDRSSMDLGSAPATVRPGSAVGWVPSACIIARRHALGSGFDAKLRVAEDVDLVWRLVAQGWAVRYDPSIVVLHDVRENCTSWLARKVAYGSGADDLAQRHGQAVSPAVLNPWSALAVIAMLAQRRWSGPVALMAVAGLGIGVSSRLASSADHRRIVRDLTIVGLKSSLIQLSSLAVRSWWPLGALLAFGPARARRALAAAIIIDTAYSYRSEPTQLNAVEFATAKRLDDLAYGTGVWLSALRARSVRALAPKVHWRTSTQKTGAKARRQRRGRS